MTASNIETRSFIAGEFAQTSGGSFTLKNPSNGETVCEVPIAGKADVDRAVAAAAAAQPAWAALPAAQRAACLNKWADLIDKNVEKIVHVDAISVGKPVGPQTNEIGITANRIRYEASLAQSLVGESSTLTPGQLGLVLREPYGVVAGICPWNVPTIMFAGKAAPAVAAGNAIIIKSSEKSPLSSLILAGLTVEAGFPPGIIQVLSGLGETGAALAEHPEIRKISFTGSTRTGRRVAEAAAKSNLKAVSLELGGKSPTILFEDADLEQAVPACTFSLLWNSGQICMANTRLYVHEKISDKFLEMFKQHCGNFKQGDPLDPQTFLGPQADEIQGNIVRSYLEAGKKEGKIAMGGEAVAGKGHFIQPTIYTDVSEDAKINKEEIFGPVAVVHRFTDEAEVIRRANDSEYGLYASVWTQDIDRAVRVARKLEAGTVGVNATSPSTANELVFGGYKQSGWAREGGVNSLHLWTQQKSVVIKYKGAI